MPYFSSAPGPTLCEDLPLPLSVMENIKNKSDALSKNISKRKLSEEASGIYIYKFYFFQKIKFFNLSSQRQIYKKNISKILIPRFKTRSEEEAEFLNN